MLENASRQLILVVLAAVAAVLALVFLPPNLGLDLSGGVQLIYEVDVQREQREGRIPADASEAQIAEVVDQTVQIISERIDPQGTLEAVVTRRGDTGILIELPRMTETETRAVEARIESLGRLEFRILANDTYAKHGVTFEIEKEKQRLREWLEANEGENRRLVAEDPQKIRLYHNLSPDEGGRLSEALKWFPQIHGPSIDNPDVWAPPESWSAGGPVQGSVAVPAFTAEQYNGGRVEEGVERLVEFLPINMDEVYFTGEDLDPGAIRPTRDEFGKPAISYEMRSDKLAPYADFSEEYIRQRCAIILNGEIHSAPTFQSRIYGTAQITSRDFTERQVNELVQTLRTGSLKVKPIQQSRDVIGATLGARSIRLAFYSMIGGSIFVLIFILGYYRLAGLVAFSGLMLNIVLILGIVGALRATLTLPGLAGLVLTMGMAIDANILIYERIREEIARGKQLLQACRSGFDRAIVTILDANITTFIAGLVLYNVGVGPIRGFAVTLMIGIITTLFTAFFVSRLVFHFLLEWKKLKEFRVARWLQDANFDFVRLTRPAFAISMVAVAIGIFLFAWRPADEKYAIDFTGGANLKVALAEPVRAQDIRELLAEDERFSELFPKPIVNTVGEQEGGKARQFAIRVKLTDELRERIDEERSADPEEYEPPYLTELRRILGDRLVEDPYSNARVYPESGSTSVDNAMIDLHFASEVRREDVEERLKTAVSAPLVRSLPPGSEKDVAKDFRVEFYVPKGTEPDLLFAMLEGNLGEIRDIEGVGAPLSQPIPESSEIGGRMVGELRNSAITAIFISLFAIVMFIRVRFHEYKYGIAAVVALLHDVLVALGVVVLFNWLGLVEAEIDLAMIAAFLTIIGYSINDTIVIFDRIRENLQERARLGERMDFGALINLSINQTLSRTILTTATTMAVVLIQFIVNYHAGTALEGFSFALVVGLISGTYSTVFIASPIVLWMWRREGGEKAPGSVEGTGKRAGEAVPAQTGA